MSALHAQPSTGGFSAEVLVLYEDRRGHDCDVYVDVDYTFDGADLRILSSRVQGNPNISDYELDELIYQATFDHALDVYPEWLVENLEYMSEERTLPPLPEAL